MNAILEILDQPAARRVGWALLHSLWQGALVAVLFGLLRLGLRRASANARYLAGCGCLALLLAVPVGTWLWMPSPKVFASIDNPLGRNAVVSGAVGTPNIPADGTHLVASGFPSRVAETLERTMPWLVAAWAIGVALFSFRLLKSCWRLRVLRLKGTEPFDAGWIERLNELQRRLRISRPVRLLKSALVEVPTVIGWLRPVILLPASSITGLSPSQLEAVIAHELAHVCRHDYLVNVFQHVVETLMFYHPAAWWISRCLREEREHCCDDLVVKVCGNRMVYARALATLEELRGDTPQLAFAASGGSLLNRIRRLLGLPVASEHSAWRQASGLALMGIGLLLVIGGVGLLLVPASYRAVAQIRVDHDTPHQVEERNGKLSFSYDLYAFQTELAMIRSPLVLNRVIENLGLRERWGKQFANGQGLAAEETLQLLARRVSVRQVENTSLVRIQAWSSDPAEAAQIANGIAESYRQYRMELATGIAQDGIKALELRFDEQNKKVREAQARADSLRQQLGILDPDPQATSMPSTITADTLREYQRSLTLYNTALAHQQAQLDNFAKLNTPRQRDAIQTTLEKPDDSLVALFVELESAERKLLALSANFTPESPTYKSAKEAIAILNEKIDRKIEGVLVGLQNRLEQTKASIVTLNESFERAKSNDLAMVEYSRPYYAAKQKLAELLQFNQILGMKLAAEKTELMLPRTSQVIITDHAIRPAEPSTPNRVRASALIVSGVLIGILGLAMRSGRRAAPAIRLSQA